MNKRDRYFGAVMGLAVCDALGAPYEFQPRGQVKCDGHMKSGGPFNLQAGDWTDDTSMALCIGYSIIDKGLLDFVDMGEKMVKWWRNGEFSSIGRCFDIGGTTAAGLRHYLETWNILDEKEGPSVPAGNGSLMGICPIPLAFHGLETDLIEAARVSSLLTHPSKDCSSACEVFSMIVNYILYDRFTKEEAVSEGLLEMQAHPERLVTDRVLAVMGSLDNPPERCTGYVVDSLHAALWAFMKYDNFKDGAIAVINLGGDTDTNAAIYGTIAGAYYGIDGIPEEWVRLLAKPSLLENMADGLLAFNNSQLEALKIAAEEYWKRYSKDG